jgi:hypothetical protein
MTKKLPFAYYLDPQPAFYDSQARLITSQDIPGIFGVTKHLKKALAANLRENGPCPGVFRILSVTPYDASPIRWDKVMVVPSPLMNPETKGQCIFPSPSPDTLCILMINGIRDQASLEQTESVIAHEVTHLTQHFKEPLRFWNAKKSVLEKLGGEGGISSNAEYNNLPWEVESHTVGMIYGFMQLFEAHPEWEFPSSANDVINAVVKGYGHDTSSGAFQSAHVIKMMLNAPARAMSNDLINGWLKDERARRVLPLAA